MAATRNDPFCMTNESILRGPMRPGDEPRVVCAAMASVREHISIFDEKASRCGDRSDATRAASAELTRAVDGVMDAIAQKDLAVWITDEHKWTTTSSVQQVARLGKRLSEGSETDVCACRQIVHCLQCSRSQYASGSSCGLVL